MMKATEAHVSMSGMSDRLRGWLNSHADKLINVQRVLVDVTPRCAALLMENNNSNRPISKHRVAEYAAAMSAGNWQPSHQGICLASNGNIIDGQHRLMAAIQSQFTLRTTISIDHRIDVSLGAPIDVGLKRTAAFVCDISKDLAQYGSALGRILIGNSAIPVIEVGKYAAMIEPQVSFLLANGSTKTKYFSSVAVGLAAAIRIKQWPDYADMIRNNYLALVAHEPHNAVPACRSLYKQILRASMARDEMFLRAYKAFDPSQPNLEKLIIRSATFIEACKEIRAFFDGRNA